MRIILTFILFPIIFCSNLSANEIDLNDPYYKLGWKNLENPTSKTIEIPDANATIEIVESEIYLDEKFDIKSYEEYINDEVLSIDDISENLIIADNEGYYTIDVEYKDEGYISSDRFKNFTSADLIETFGKRDFDSSVKFSWALEPKLSEDKVAVYGTKADFDDGFVIYFYSAKILGRQGFLDLTLSLSGDGTESEEYLSYYSEIIEEIASTVKFKDKFKYSDYTEEDYLSPYTLTNIIDGTWGEGVATDLTNIYGNCLITTGALKKAGITKEDYPRFAGKVINFYISDVRNEIMDLSSDDEVNVITGMYGFQDRQNYQKLNISPNNSRSYDVSYTNVIELKADNPSNKVKYEYKNKLVIKDGVPKLLFAKIDQTGLSFNKWNLTIGCQDKEYTEEEILTAKYDKSNPLLKNIDPKILNKVIIEGDKVTKKRGNKKETAPFNYSLLIEQDGTDYMIVNRYPGIQSGKLLKFTYVYNSKSEYAQFFEQVYKNGPNPNLITSIQPNKFNIDGELEDYISSEYVLDDFNFSYSTRMGDYMLNFETETGGERVLSYISNKESFSLASYLENEAWHASTFKVLSNIEDFKNLAKNYPSTLCNILWEPLLKDLNIKELNNLNLEEELNSNGINRDSLGCK